MTVFSFTGIHHAAFATADMNRTIEYWRDLLGLPLAITFSGRNGRQYAFSLPGGMLIYFFEWPEVKPQPPKKHGQPVQGPFHFDHLALGLASIAELYHLQDKLVECELPVSDVIDHGYLHSIYTFDPNGIPLEFNSLVKAVNLAQTPVLADETPPPAVKEGSFPVTGKWPDALRDDANRLIIPGEDRGIFSR